MGSMIPCYDCFSEDGEIDYGDFKPTSWPCCNCGSRFYKEKGMKEVAKENRDDNSRVIKNSQANSV